MRMGRRRRRASLRGWWRVLPFVAGAGLLFLMFSWLNTHLLRNEYRSIELTAEIQRVKERIAELRGERFELGRLERMDEYAPKQELKEPRPGQVQIVTPTAEELTELAAAVRHPAKTERATRSVVMLLKGVDAPAPTPAAPSTALAHSESADSAEAASKL